MSGVSGIAQLTVFPKAAKVAIDFDRRQTDAGSLKDKLGSLGFPVQKRGAPEGAGVALHLGQRQMQHDRATWLWQQSDP